MKSRIQFLTSALILLALLSATNLASAYYDPGVQRWLNRDPFLEPGFETVRNDIPAGLRRLQSLGEFVERPNLYTFTDNEPVSHRDPNGLMLVPCPSEYVAACSAICALDGKWSVAICQVWFEPGGHIHIRTNCRCMPFRTCLVNRQN